MTHPSGLFASHWPAEDGGPLRREAPHGIGGLGIRPGEALHATSRLAISCTMVVVREPGEVYLLCHTGGDDAISWVEQIDPITLEVVRRSPDLPAGPIWPGGMAAHENGSLHVVVGMHAHRLSPQLQIEAHLELPRRRPYNSFVVLADGSLATKDFGGLRPGHTEPDGLGASELLVLDPDTLQVRASCVLPEASIARLSADGDDVYVVGETTLWRVRWDGSSLVLDDDFGARYRTLDGQSYGWDAVIDGGAAWFLDNGAGSEQYGGSFTGIGTNVAPLHLIRIDLASGAVDMVEVCGRPGGLIANPPAIDIERGIAIGYDSSNAIVTAFDLGGSSIGAVRWQIPLAHAAHPLRFADTGELVLCDFDAERGTDQLVVLDISSGHEIARVDTGSPFQSVLFLAPGFQRDVYACTFTTVSRLWVE